MDDCIIIGAGPAGLTAAIYLARYHLSIRLFDCGTSRAAWIPCTRNHAGFPDGIEGKELLRRMYEQAHKYGAIREEKQVEHLAKTGDVFVVGTDTGTYRARTVLLATGVVNHRPASFPDELHGEARFDTLEHLLEMVFRGDGRGDFTIAGKATDDPAYGNRLLFELAVDRAQLKLAVEQLDGLLRAYPSRGARHYTATTLRAH